MSHKIKTMELTGWGRYPRALCRVTRPDTVAAIQFGNESSLIARGAGRSYGDAAASSTGLVFLTEALTRQFSLDEQTGLVIAEAGTTTQEVLDACVPRGWFPAVTPGTKFVTLGGSVAADVHGKNHYRAGTFSRDLHGLELVLAEGQVVSCSPLENVDLYRATIGGMGLSGIITKVSFNLRRIETSFVIAQHHPAQDLDESLALLEDSLNEEYAVCWIDSVASGKSLGRGVLITGHHAAASELPPEFEQLRNPRKPLTLPVDVPSWILNPLTAGFFNRLYFRKQAAKREPFVADFDSFFYPLDAVNDWNRFYGKRGFVQYQCVLPIAASRAGFRAILEASVASRVPSFLAVLKRFGAEGPGILSFPMPGLSLSMDFPVRAQTFDLLRTFDEIVVSCGGRVYLAKDACLDDETFRRMYPRLAEWQEIKKRFDPNDRFCSDLSIRLAICRPSN